MGSSSGLDINDPDEKYSLKALPGKLSGLHLLAIMYTAFRQIDPTMDTGVDFAAEYKAALELQKNIAAASAARPDVGRLHVGRRLGRLPPRLWSRPRRHVLHERRD